MKITIRTAVVGDYEGIYLLNAHGLGYDYSIEKTRQRLVQILQKENNRIFVAEIENKIVGYIHSADYDCTYVDSLKDILALAVDKSYRGKGIGNTLLLAAEEWAKETGSLGVRLVSGIDREEAHKFYKACGYVNRKNQMNFIKWFNS